MGYLIILIIVVFAVYYIANDKKGKLEVFKRYNGEEKGIVNSIGDIRCFFDMRDEDEYTFSGSSSSNFKLTLASSIKSRYDKVHYHRGNRRKGYTEKNPAF